MKEAKEMKFQKHTSDELVDLFFQRPFQGQSPEKASIIFLSSDANYSSKISSDSFFKFILEYQGDGVAFWKKHGYHHPFMLSCYPFNKNMAGVPFHRNFSKLKLGPEHAHHISFLELLDVPTIGNKTENRDEFFNLLSLAHLKYIENLILGGGHKLFFVSNGVVKDIEKINRRYSVFGCLKGLSENQALSFENGNKVKQIYHFSSSQIHGQLREVRSEIDLWLT
ncbi:MAG: hypothetical protein M0T70_09785 [Geobacteraceae bacterium]|nr:hypothetical protein [Geobacteraceae bacterium]